MFHAIPISRGTEYSRNVAVSHVKLAALCMVDCMSVVCFMHHGDPHQRSCCCTRHPDIVGSPLACVFPDRFGFGSVHYMRDFGDTVKLVHAMGRIEADGQVKK